jgi:hypothetical protein
MAYKIKQEITSYTVVSFLGGNNQKYVGMFAYIESIRE